MAGLMDPRLAELLEARREALNQRFLQVRHQHRQLAPADFSEVLRERVLPVAEAILRAAPERLEPAFEALYDGALRLTALDLLGPGSRQPLMDRAFVELLPRAAHLIAPAPGESIPALLNALYNLNMEPAADAERWLGIMLEQAGEESNSGVYLDAGKVAAWICGMAHYREGALAIAPRLPREQLALMLGDSNGSDPLDQLSDPWGTAETNPQPRLVGRAGGFVGFGGPFVEPPELACFDGQLYAFDRQGAWRLYADRFGILLRRYGTDLPAGDPQENPGFRINRKGEVRLGQQSANLPQLAGYSSQAATDHTLAVALPHSHHLFLVALA
jgi:hypothetical protein